MRKELRASSRCLHFRRPRARFDDAPGRERGIRRARHSRKALARGQHEPLSIGRARAPLSRLVQYLPATHRRAAGSSGVVSGQE